MSTRDVPEQLNHLKKIFEETFEDVSSAKEVKKTIDRLLTHQFPLDPQWEHKLGNRLSQLDGYCKIKPSEFPFRSIRRVLTEIDNLLRQLAAEADKNDFPPLSETGRAIISGEHEILKRLRVSYEFFHRRLKRDPRICLFLAIFPENAVLRKMFLIYWWIGEGLVPNEEEGERVFEELLDLELLTPHRTDKCPRVSKCQISPWIRYMLISVAQKEKLLNLDGAGIPRFDPTHSRSTCLIADDHTHLKGEEENLRSIFNVNQRDLEFPQQWLAKLTGLVVLHLGRWQVSPTHHIEVVDESFLTGLKTQKLLKYLSLHGISRITSLPGSIKELVSLEIPDLKACHNLETLPDEVASLRKLTHLDVSECYLLESMPKGLDKLTSLQVLKGFVIGNSQKSHVRIGHLGSLEKLKRLSIHIGSESEANILKEEFDKLKDLKNVKCLKISWGKADDVEVSPSFPQELQKLALDGIPLETKPRWLAPSKLMKLEKLHIKGGKLKNLWDEGEKWDSVKYLVIKYTEVPPMKETSLRSTFPSLQYVKKVGREQGNAEYEWNKEQAIAEEYPDILPRVNVGALSEEILGL